VISAAARCFPAVSRLRKYPPSSQGYIPLQILGFFPDRQPYRLLYIAETSGVDKRLVLIKFAPRYSIELHEFCAQLCHAPAILAFEQLPGGWCAVAMEYIESGVTITHSSKLSTHHDHWITQLQDLMHAFHANDFVHGDLRDANIMCHEESVMLIDFDWGGKDGEAVYPTLNLNDELLQGRESDDLKITREDDQRVLAHTLAKIRSSVLLMS
jgi:serine/threonine protein kinase